MRGEITLFEMTVFNFSVKFVYNAHKYTNIITKHRCNIIIRNVCWQISQQISYKTRKKGNKQNCKNVTQIRQSLSWHRSSLQWKYGNNRVVIVMAMRLLFIARKLPSGKLKLCNLWYLRHFGVQSLFGSYGTRKLMGNGKVEYKNKNIASS